MTGPQPSTPSAGDGLAAARARAAELGVPLSDFVRDELRRARADQAWEQAVMQAEELGRAARRARWEELAAAVLADLGDSATREATLRQPGPAGPGRQARAQP